MGARLKIVFQACIVANFSIRKKDHQHPDTYREMI